jgi:ribosomal protein L40E
MARKSLGYIKLAWTCDRCDGENPGPRRFCNSCGAPQPPDVEFHQPAQAIFVTKPEELEAAKAGADVHCPYCNARNPATATFCGACGGGLEGAEVRQAGKVLGAYRTGAALPKICPSCGTHNTAAAVECAGCGDDLSPEPSSPKIEAQPAKPKKRGLSIPVIIGAAVGCLALGGILWGLLGRSEEITATVSEVSWNRSIPIEILGEIEGEDWIDEIPSGAEIQFCETAYRYSQDEPAPGAVEVCGTPYTVDEGSGYGEVVQDCEYEVYDDRCTFTSIDWIVFDTLTVSGDDLSPAWPEAQLTSDQRFGEGQEDFEVTFKGADQTYRFSPGSESEFTRFAVGSSWNLTVNALGGITSLEPAR